MPVRALILCLVLGLLLGLTGCASKSAPGEGQIPDASPDGAAAQSSPTNPAGAKSAGGPLLRYSADFVYAPTPPPSPTAPTTSPTPTTSPAPAASAAPAPPPELMRALNAASLLLKLKDSPPDDVQGLEFRIDKDEAEALRLLQAFGYYDGTASRAVLGGAGANTASAQQSSAPDALQTSAAGPAARMSAAEAAPAHASPADMQGGTSADASKAGADLWRVRLTLTPGQRYRVGETVVRYVEGGDGLPASLEEAGLPAGAPAEASRILQAVERLPEMLGRRGYPLAEVKGTRYAVDKDTRQLFATVLVQTGPRARMGRVVMRGESHVQPAYLEKLRPWEQGMEWDQRLVEDYRDLLVRQGLFRSIELHPEPAAAAAPAAADATASAATATANGSAERLVLSESADTTTSATGATPPNAASVGTATPVYDLVATLADAPQRTVGGGLNYESNRGPGVQAYWEHRNLLGQGERFRAEASVWQDSQFARATFRKPAFLDRSQELTAEAWLRNEDTNAYTQRAAWVSAGLERRLWGPLFASAGVAVEGGDLKDPTHPLRAYTMAGFPLQVRYEGASGPGGAQLDPERGVRATLGVRPSWGEYAGSFFITPTRFTVSGYVPLGTVGVDADTGRVIPRMVLAARGAAGTLWRGDSQRIPAAARYYGGGGGSVRGYAYQSLGPRDRNNDPLGGASFAEVSVEARVRITENIAIVPFLDGGNVYSGVTPGFERDGTNTGLQWGAGLGLRYHTVVGPLRLDVATPLNPREDDGKFFLYISIGQSF